MKDATDDGIVTRFSEKMEADSLLNTTSSSTPLRCIRLSDERLDQSTDLSFFVESTHSNPSALSFYRRGVCPPHLSMLSRVDDGGDIGNRDSSLGKIGRYAGKQSSAKRQSKESS